MGTLRMRGTQISDLLILKGATLRGGDTALFGVGMQVGTFDFSLAARPTGAVDLQGARATVLHDREQSWPEEVRMDGFVYGSLRSERTPSRRMLPTAWRGSAGTLATPRSRTSS